MIAGGETRSASIKQGLNMKSNHPREVNETELVLVFVTDRSLVLMNAVAKVFLFAFWTDPVSKSCSRPCRNILLKRLPFIIYVPDLLAI